MPPIDWILLTAVSFIAALVQGATGFGFAIVAVPFYLIILGSLSAIQVSLIVTLSITILVAMRVWRNAPPALLGRLIGGTLAGFPAGILAYRDHPHSRDLAAFCETAGQTRARDLP